MQISSRIERERQTLHPKDGLVYHMAKVPWTHFITLTFRVVPPNYVLQKCLFEFIRRTLKEFNSNPDFHWGTNWIVRKEYGEKNGRVHYHLLMVLDKPYPNAIATCKKIEHIWRKEVASRQVGRYNQEKDNYNARLRRELKYKPYEVRSEEYAKRCRPHIRNDFSSPGFADVRQFDPGLDGVGYVMKGDDWSYSGANAYELAKFNNRDNTDHILSHKLLMRLFLKNSAKKPRRRDKALFRQEMVDMTPQVDKRKLDSGMDPKAIILKAPDTMSQTLWDTDPDYVTDQTWSWTRSQF